MSPWTALGWCLVVGFGVPCAGFSLWCMGTLAYLVLTRFGSAQPSSTDGGTK